MVATTLPVFAWPPTYSRPSITETVPGLVANESELAT
jgi:hypothetical protein